MLIILYILLVFGVIDMNKLKLIAKIFVLSLCLFAVVQISTFRNSNYNRFSKLNECKPVISLVKTKLPDLNGNMPLPKREKEYRYYLQCSIRIHANNSAGSGTICYYDKENNEAWVISCGHLFDGDKPPWQKWGTHHARIDVFYKNDLQLIAPQSFEANVICYDSNEDISILTFKPDWEPQHYFPIAPIQFLIREGDLYESTGCDHAGEVASYTVKVVDGMNSGQNLITKNNSPRPGRSGGALLSDDGYFLAIVWGTSALDGSGYGFYVPLRRIHNYLRRYEETKDLLTVANLRGTIHLIPIMGEDGNLRPLPRGFLPYP